MSTAFAHKPTSKSWIHLVVWAQVALGLAGLVAFLATPTAGVVVGVAVAVVRSLARARRKMEQIFAEELD
jgi:hypothetical protein